MKDELNIGFGHTVKKDQVVGIFMVRGAALKHLRDLAKAESRLVDASNGRRTRAIIVTISNHVILSAITPETLWSRAGDVVDMKCRGGGSAPAGGG